MISLNQAKSLTRGTVLYHAQHWDADGSPLKCRVDGKPKTHKHDPGYVEVWIKHSRYRYEAISTSTLHRVCFTEREAQIITDGTSQGRMLAVILAAQDLFREAVPDDCDYDTFNRGLDVVARIAESWGYLFIELWRAMGKTNDDYDRAADVARTFTDDAPGYVIIDAIQDAGLPLHVAQTIAFDRDC